MRSVLSMVLVLTLASVPVAQAQQVVAPVVVEEPVRSLAEVLEPRIQPEAVPAPAVLTQPEVVTADARREVSARTVLAVVGGVVLVVALIALLR